MTTLFVSLKNVFPNNTPPKNTHQRIVWVDALRGFALVLMIIFHFCYDLRYFHYVDWQVPNGPHWWPFRYLILTLFIFTAGMSLSLSHKRQFRLNAFAKRVCQLVVAALAITVLSLFMFKNTWIYFGILHFMAATSLIGVFFVKIPRVALAVGAAILLSDWLGLINSRLPFEFFSAWLPNHTEDFVPLIPWLGVMLLGVGIAGCCALHQLPIKTNTVMNALAVIGKKSLLIYLIHQPILFSAFYLLELIK